LSGTGLCDEPVTRPKESYRLWCVVVCDLETSRMRRPYPTLGRSATRKKNKLVNELVHVTFLVVMSLGSTVTVSVIASYPHFNILRLKLRDNTNSLCSRDCLETCHCLVSWNTCVSVSEMAFNRVRPSEHSNGNRARNFYSLL